MSTVSPTRGTWRERVKALSNIPPVLRLIWEASPRLVVATLTLRIIVALAPLALISVLKYITDLVLSHRNQISSLETVPVEIWYLLALQFGIAIVAAALSRAVDYCEARMADEFTRTASLRIMEHASSLDLASFEDPIFYDKLERARVQSTDRIAMVNSMGRLVQEIVGLVSFIAVVIAFSPILFLILLVCVVPAFLGESHFAFLGYSLAYSQTPVRRELDYLRILSTNREGAKEMKLFGLAKYFRDRFAQRTAELIRQNRSLLGRRLRSGAFFAAISSLGYYGSFAYVVFRTLQGHLTIGGMGMLAGAIQGASNQLQAVFSTFSSIADQSLFLTDLVQFFAVTPKITSHPNALPAPRPIRQGIEFRDVCFRYPGSERLILDHFNFRLEPGERVAIVGANGEGKTTMVKLLARLYDPTSGGIFLDGVDLREYSIEDWHKEIGVIFQDFLRYDMTVRDNIAFGRLEDLDNHARLEQAARESRADEVIAKLPLGFEQLLGRRFEGGLDLSGGEWQRIAIARAYLRDAQLLILDEPTAALDAQAEYAVFCRFAELTENKMSILISHRFSTVKMANRIAVVQRGRVSEEGTHQELIKLAGHYAQLFELQAANYR